MTLFEKLYDFCQTQSLPISRNTIRDKIVELTGSPVVCRVHGFNTRILRGYYLASDDQFGKFPAEAGKTVVLLARNLDKNWERLVYVKELMHVFDTSLTDTPEKFEELFKALLVQHAPTTTQSTLLQSEHLAVWLALMCLCPEKDREALKVQYLAKAIDAYEVASRVKIPEAFVPYLFAHDFACIKQVIATVTK